MYFKQYSDKESDSICKSVTDYKFKFNKEPDAGIFFFTNCDSYNNTDSVTIAKSVAHFQSDSNNKHNWVAKQVGI